MRELTSDERQELQRELSAVAANWARRLNACDIDAQRRKDHERSYPDGMRTHLARMAAGEQMRRFLADLVSASAEEAAMCGAGYPELGAAVGASRQAARKRWPNLSISKGRTNEWKQPPGSIGWAGSHLGYPGPPGT
ncbi:hypothetical protein [Micromonospora sp. SL4-19]|uniref:hypothetical protein n=1 Tax=Micromonospora sp. SL4-19 TaxID=3399129 RepID=UPI003A4D6896